MPSKIISYDAAVIHEFAARLYSKANSVIVTSTFGGAIIGSLVGGILGFVVAQLPRSYTGMSNEPMTAIQIGALVVCLIGALSGYSRGREKAFRFMLDAQVALCQVQIEKNTSSKS